MNDISSERTNRGSRKFQRNSEALRKDQSEFDCVCEFRMDQMKTVGRASGIDELNFKKMKVQNCEVDYR